MAGSSEVAFLVPVIAFTLIILSGTAFIITWLNKRSKDNAKTSRSEPKESQSHRNKNKGFPAKQNKKKPVPIMKGGEAAPHKFDHSHLIATLKGHTGQLTGGEFSANGKQFITSAEDRTVFIWNTKDFPNRDRKSFRCNIDYDYAHHICWSPDSRAFIIHKSVDNTIEVYKIIKKPNGTIGEIQKAITFPEYDRDVILITLDVAINGKFMMTCDNKNQLILWDLKGKVLEKLDTRHGDTYSATISPCGRFIVTTGFTPDAKVYEVKYSKTGTYEKLKRIFDLTGHSAGIYNCSVNCDSSKMATASKDGTWRLYNTFVEYEKGQDPYFLLSGQFEKQERAYVSLSPDGRTVAVASGPDLIFYSAITGESLYSIDKIYPEFIKEIKFDHGSKYLLTIGDKHVRIFHNVAGFYTAIQDLEKSKSSAKTIAMQERIATQISDAKAALQKIKKRL